MSEMETKITAPKRVSRSYRQSLAAGAAEVFPLLCPVREIDWVPGWQPIEVRSASGVAELDCVFFTHTDSGSPATWMITRHDPESLTLQMVKLTPGVTACRLDIALRDVSERASEAIVSYTHTSLGPAGDSFVDAFTEEHYRAFMQRWEEELNVHLARQSSGAYGFR